MQDPSSRDLSFPALGPEGFLKICYREWGEQANLRVLICVHGLSRNRRDFDALGADMSDAWRVLAPDMPGRGGSDWLEDKTGYTMDLYARVCAAAIARSGAAGVDWVGTSMGGLIGMALAAQPNSPIRRLVINDIGPRIPAAGRRDNAAGFGSDPRFADMAEAVDWHKRHRAGFGPMSEAAWRQMTEVSLRGRADGGFALHYDPGLAVLQRQALDRDVEQWAQWERIRCPVLTIWGTASKLLLAGDLERMQATGLGTEVLAVEGVGHAPAVAGARVLGAIRDFLAAP